MVIALWYSLDILLNVFLAIAVDNLSDEDEDDEEGGMDDDNDVDDRPGSSAAAKKAADAWVDIIFPPRWCILLINLN